MYIKFNSLFIILIALLLSCKNQNNGNEPQNSEKDSLVRQDNPNERIEKSMEINLIIEQLQGKWKEIEYPHRTAEFANSTVKFIEEGTVANPAFEAFELSTECPFDNNNIRDLTSSDIILTLPESERCEKLMVSADTLKLSGFSSNTNENYNIVYLRLE